MLCAAVFLVQSLLSAILPAKASVQSGYRWRNDDGSETTATYAATQNTPIIGVPVGTTERLRIGVNHADTETSLARTAQVGTGATSDYRASAIDLTNGYVYYATVDTPIRVVKIRLSDYTIVGTATMNSGENTSTTMVLDIANGFGYVGTSSSHVVKFSMGAGAAAPSRVGSLSLGALPVSSVIDNTNHFAYFGTTSTSLIKVNLTTFAITSTLTTGVTGVPDAGVIDVTNNRMFWATRESPSKILRVTISTFTVSTSITLGTGESSPVSGAAALDQTNQFAYFAMGGDNSVVKINTSSFGETAHLVLTGNDGTTALAMDTNKGYIYTGSSTNPGNVTRIRASDLTKIGSSLTLISGDRYLEAATIDPTNGYLYLGIKTITSQNGVKIDIFNRNNFRLEYGVKASTCAAVASWTQVPATATSEHWEMSDSANLTDGAATTDSAGLTNGGTTFVAGQVKDTSSQASEVVLFDSRFTEVEYSIKATVNAASSGFYCFRLTNAGGTTDYTYNNYPEATLASSGADLSLTKSVNNAAPNVGGTVTYTLTLTNGGPVAATAAVKDLLPAGLTFVSATPSQGSYNSSTGTWSVGSIGFNATATLQIAATVNTGTAGNTITNTAEVLSSDQADPDSTPNNNNGSEDDQASAALTVQSADLSLTKTVDNATPNVGGTIVYTVTVTNGGPQSATNVSAKDLLPSGVTYVSNTPSQGSYVSGTGIWTIGTIASGTSKNITITATVNSGTGGTTITNTAQVTASDVGDPDSTPNNNNAGEDDQASQNIVVNSADLSLTKVLNSTPTPNVGTNVQYLLTLTNGGPQSATGVVVTDLLPSGLTFVSAAPTSGTTYNSATGGWTIGTIAASTSKTLTLTASVNSGSDGLTITNTAQVSASGVVDPDSTPNNSNAGEDDQQSVSVTVNTISPTLTRSIPFTSSTGYTQQDSSKTKFTGGAVQLGADQTVGGVTAVSNNVSGTPYSTVDDGLIVPATGAITSWRVYSFNTTSLKLKAYLKNSANNYTLRGDSTVQSVNATSVNGPFSTNIPVVSGDKIGLYGALNPISTTGNGNTFLWNAGDFTGTGSFSNFDTAHSHPNIEFTLTTYNTAQDWYVTTTDTTRVKTRTWTGVTGVTFTQTTPGSTTIKYLVSFDGRTTWKYWTGSAWATSTLAAIQTNGNTKATLEGLSSANWSSANGFVAGTTLGIDVAVDLKTTSNSATPSVDNIAFTYTAPTDISVNYATANEANYTQEDAANGTDFTSGTVILHQSTGASGTPISLSGGSGGTSGLTTYTAPDGTTVVSSVPTWNNGSLYYMQYMFDGSALTGTPTDTQIWLGSGPSCSTGAPCTMLITLPAARALDHVRVYPYARSADWSEYTIAVSADAATWTYIAGSGNTSTGVGTSFTHTSQGSAGDLFDYSSIGTYKYIKFSLTRQGSNGPALNEIQIYPTASTYTTTGKYVTTANASHINTTGWTAVGGVYTSETTPTNTTLKYLVSFDNRSTWKFWNGSAWTSSTLANIGTNGMSKTTFEALAWDDWQSSGGFIPGTTTTLDLAAQLKTSDNLVTPTLDQLSVEYSTLAYDPSADLSVGKTVNFATPHEGDSISYTVSATNSGPNVTTGVTITDLLPAGLTYVSSTPSQGSYVNGTGVWTVGTMESGQVVSLQISATVNAGTGGTTITNTAQVTASSQTDPDSTPNNNNAGEDDQASRAINVRPITADLSLTKSVNNATPNVGANVIYTVNVTSGGPDTATNVIVTDLLPAGVTYVSSTPSQGTYNSATGGWTIGTIASGATKTLTITASVNSGTGGTTITNTAQVKASDQTDPDSTPNNSNAGEDDQASASITVNSADLSLTKGVNNATPNVGANVTYTVTATNGGPNSATNVIVTDLLPAGVTYVSSTPSQGTYNSATGGWTIGTIAASTSKTLTITASVNSGTGGTTITNTAQVSASDVSDPDSTPNNSNAGEDDQASQSITVNSADLSVTKTVDDSTPAEGGTVVYTVTVTNGGPNSATNVAVKDLLPAGVTYVSNTPSQGSYVSGTGIWTVGTIASSTSKNITITATVNAGQAGNTITNTAQVSASDVSDPDSTPNNNNAGEDDQDSENITVDALSSDLSLTKSVDNATPTEGASIVYTITVANGGPNSAASVAVTDLLPSGVTYVSSSPSQGTYNSATGGWTIGTIANGATKTLTITATVDSGTTGTTITNTAQVSASGSADPDSTPNNNNAGEDDQDSEAITVGQADLSLTKTVDESTPSVGGTIVYTVTVTNAGPASATGVIAKDLLPSGVTYVSDTPSQGTYVSGTGFWTIGTIASGASKTLTITATVNSGTAETTIDNVAQITTSNQPDPDSTPNNNNASEDDQDDAPIVVNATASNTDRISVSDGEAQAGNASGVGVDAMSISSDGNLVAFTSSATNLVSGDTNGVADVFVRNRAAGTTVRASVDTAGTQNTSSSAQPHLSADGRYVVFTTLGNLVAGDTAGLDVFRRDLQTNTTVLASPRSDNGANSSGNNPSISGDGRYVAYNTNTAAHFTGDTNGLHDVFRRDMVGNATIRVSLRPGGLQTTNGNSINPSISRDGRYIAFESDDNAIVSGDTNNQTDIFVYDVNSGTTVRASLTSTGGESNGDCTNASISGDGTAVAFECDSTNMVPGDSNAADDIFVRDLVGNTTTRVSVSTGGGQGTGVSGTTGADAPNMANDGRFVSFRSGFDNLVGDDTNNKLDIFVHDRQTGITYRASVASDGTQGNGDVQTSSAINDDDPITVFSSESSNLVPGDSNGASDVFMNESGESEADLSVDKTVDDPTPLIGQEIVYTITVSNGGPVDATGVTVDDVLPGGLTYVSNTASQGTWFHAGGNNNGDWVIGTIAGGGSATLTIHATVNPGTGGQTITNTAQVIASGVADPDSTPNNSNAGEDDQDSVSLTVEGASDLSLTKDVSNPAPLIGQNFTYTITVTNGGPDAATHVKVKDVLSGNLTYVSDTPSQGTWFHNGGNNDGEWWLGTPLNSGASATLVITAKPNSHTGGFVITNTAQVMDSDQTDADSTPNNSNASEDDQDSASLTVEGSSDLSVNKIVDNPSPSVGNTIIYTVTVSNAGPDQATNITVHDVLPGGLTYVSNTASQGTWFHSGGNNNGDWVLGTPLNNGASATLTIHATVNAGTGGATITNTAEVTQVDQNDPDSTRNNNNAGEDDQDSVDLTVGGTPTTADLSLTKTVNDPTPIAGDTVTYTVTVTNHGPLADSGITVTDLLPAGLTYVSDTPSQGSYVSGTGIWTVGSLSNGASANIQIQAHVDDSAKGTTVTNTAEVTTAAVTDFDSTPNNHDADEDDQHSVSFDVPAATANVTENNSVAMSRLKVGVTSTPTVHFTLVDRLSGTLTVTFADDFTILSAPTSGTCSDGGTLDTFGFDDNTKTMTAEKHQCAGDVTLTGGTVTNPAVPGPYRIDWVNDDPGFTIVAITSDDQIMVTAAVNPYITFQVTTDQSGANAACDHGDDGDSQDHSPNSDGGVVQLGLLSSTSVASSDANRSGAATDDGDSDASPVTAGTEVQHICTFVSTNAGGGYALTVQSENGALGSDAVPGDTIPETPVTGAPASVLMTPGAAHYGMCLSTADVPSMDATTPIGFNLTATAPYDSGTCTGVNTAQNAGELSTQTTEIGSNAGPVQEGTAQWLVKASITASTPAHADYDDTLTFIATGSF